MTAAEAMAAYRKREREIRATMNPATREFAAAMSQACAEYERAMVDALGTARARKLGAGRRSL